MNLDLDSGLEPGATLAESLRLSRPAIVRLALAVVVLIDSVAFVIPHAALTLDLRREMAELEERQRAARLATEGAVEHAARATHRREAQSRLNPRDLLPAVSALARQEGIRIVTIKQSAVGKQGAARRLHLQARGAFGHIVAFIDAVSAEIPFGKVEDLVLRHLATPSQQDPGIELEYVLSVSSAESKVEGSAETLGSGTR